MASSLDTPFVVDLALIFVVLFLLLVTASVVGRSRKRRIGQVVLRYGWDSASGPEIRLWMVASGLGVALFVVVATVFVLVFALPSGATPSLESILLSVSLYVCAILFFTLYRFFGSVGRILEESVRVPT
jgi:hypothetical protein